MKFKNYVNSLTGDNRIFSNKEIANMTVKEAFGRQDEILAQHNQIGIPSEKELQASDNVVHVNAYTRDDGTEVRAHWRSKPDGIQSNNLSAEKNSSYTSSGTSTGGASEIEDTDDIDYLDYTVDEPVVDVSTPEKVQKLMYPDEIAGVKRGEPKNFIQMMQLGVNPDYGIEDDISGKYTKNCQSCNVACELIIRGYNVEANPWGNDIAKELSKVYNSAYIDPKTGKKCIPQKINIEEVNCYDYLNNAIKAGERYEFSYYTTPEDGEYSDTGAHTVFMTRLEDGKLIVYDGQNGDIAYGEEQVRLFITSEINEYNTIFEPRILRVDDKLLNPYYINAVVRPHRRHLKN